VTPPVGEFVGRIFRIRCFDYWRLDDQKPYRAAINANYSEAAERCAKVNLHPSAGKRDVVQHSHGEESAAVLKAIPDRNFMLNWDPGNGRSHRKYAVSRRLSTVAQTAHWALPLQGCGAQAGW